MAAVDLLFSQAPATGHPVNLLFGGDDVAALDVVIVTFGAALQIPPLVGVVLVGTVTDAALAVPIATPALQGDLRIGGVEFVSLAGVLPAQDLQGDILVGPAATALLAGVLPPVELTATLPAAYLSNTQRPIVGDVSQPWQKAGVISVGTQDRSQDTESMPVGVAQAWQPAISTPHGHETGFVSADRAHSTVDDGFQTAAKQDTAAEALHSNAIRSMRQMLATAFKEAQRVQTTINRQRHQDGIRDYTSTRRTDWQVAERGRISGLTCFQGPGVPLNKGWNEDHQTAMRPPAGMNVRPVIVPPREVCYTPDPNLLFWQAPGSDLVFICEKHGTTPPAPGATVVVPVRKVYMVINNASLRRVDGNIQLPVFNMSLSLDTDSWTWSFSAALPSVALPDLEPSETGAPVEVEAMINGVPYRALVERIGRERSFGKSDLRVSGRGKTALLDSPYAPAQNFGNTSDRTAQQIMGDVLSVNGVAMDWTLDWQLDDWLVPAGVFSQQGSYIAAVNAIAAAAGGYVQPHASLQTLHILPRYPVAPWAWDSVTPDFTLPSDVTTRESIEWVERARYNRVFVSGQQSGILGQVTRAGTAGDLLAPMVTDALITTASVARQRGISILGNTGRQAEISLRMPVLAETGIITPGKFVQYIDAGVSRVGIVRSTGVEVGMPEIWQTLGVETHA